MLIKVQDSMARMTVRTKSFWDRFLKFAQKEIAAKECSGEKVPYPPSPALVAFFNEAVTTYHGDKYAEIAKLREIFNFSKGGEICEASRRKA